MTPLREAATKLAELDPQEKAGEPSLAALRHVASWLSQHLADSPETAGFAEPATLRRLLRRDATTMTTRWVQDVLARRWMPISAEPSALAPLLEADEPELRAASALALLAADLPAILVRILVDAASSGDDRVRNATPDQLNRLCTREIRDEDDEDLVEWTHRRLASADGREGTVLADAVYQFTYTTPFWPLRWLNTLASATEDDPARRLAQSALLYINPDAPAGIRHDS